ncbi:hypothetical protein BH09ACT12_BH09ACT12_02900 [soil metagenome]
MSVWRGSQARVALAVIAVMTIWRGVLLDGSFFNQDDYYLSGRAYTSDLTWGYLFRDTAGHVNPAQQLVYWLVAHGAAYDWRVVATFVLALQVLATVVMWHVLTRLLPGRWVRVPLLAAFAWSPLSLMTTLWWSAAMGLWPHLVCSLLAVLFLIRVRQHAGATWLNYVVIVAVTLLGLSWHERAVLIAPVLLATAVTLADEAVGWRRIPAALKRYWPLWVSLAILLAGYLVAHSSLTSVEGGSNDPSESLAIAWAYVGQNVVPGMASGPWGATLRGGAVEPYLWVTITSGLLVVLAAGLLLWRGGPARRWALAFFVAYVLADLLLVLAGRGGFGRLIGLDPRYSSDVIHAAVLCVALALRGASAGYGFRLPARVTWTRARSVVLMAATAAYVWGAVVGSATLVPHFQNVEDRVYLTNLRGDLAADPNQVIVDALAPADIVLPLVGEDSLLSALLAPLPAAPVFDEPSARMRTVSKDGRLVEVTLDGSIPMRPGPVYDCGYDVKAAPTRIPLAVEIAGRVVVHLSYFTDTEATVAVSVGSWQETFLARSGPNEMWFVIPDLGDAVTALYLQVEGPSTVCVNQLEVGLPEAAE